MNETRIKITRPEHLALLEKSNGRDVYTAFGSHIWLITDNPLNDWAIKELCVLRGVKHPSTI